MLRQKLSRILTNLPGWRTHRKIVVIDSDDWGSIRMPDKAAYDILLAKGIRVDKCPYNRYDCLASEKDFTALFEVLGRFRDINGNTPVITANCVLANPDFEKIRDSGFREYHYELFTETLKRYPDHSSSFQLWEEGINNNFFHPQFHGREHLNVKRWMKALKQNLPETRLAFDMKLFGISTNITSEHRKSYLAAFDNDESDDEVLFKEIIDDGLTLFKEIFNYKPKSFIAPNYIWSPRIENYLSNHNVKYIKGIQVQFLPALNLAKSKKIRHFTGQSNSNGQIYLVRNCFFEPSLEHNKDSVDECLAQIRDSFSWKKPAIISTHRLNFIGSIDPLNRDRNLLLLNDLFLKIQKKWPDVEYKTIVQLGDLISNENDM
jgi:hypothetical protein